MKRTGHDLLVTRDDDELAPCAAIGTGEEPRYGLHALPPTHVELQHHPSSECSLEQSDTRGEVARLRKGEMQAAVTSELGPDG